MASGFKLLEENGELHAYAYHTLKLIITKHFLLILFEINATFCWNYICIQMFRTKWNQPPDWMTVFNIHVYTKFNFYTSTVSNFIAAKSIYELAKQNFFLNIVYDLSISFLFSSTVLENYFRQKIFCWNCHFVVLFPGPTSSVWFLDQISSLLI